MTVVLDSWAVLRFLEDSGSAADAVSELLADQRPLVSWINLGEVFSVVRRRHGEEAATDVVRDLRDVLDARLPDERLIVEAARIKATWPMAYADAFAAALAITSDGTLWTGDPELLLDGAPWSWRDLRD